VTSRFLAWVFYCSGVSSDFSEFCLDFLFGVSSWKFFIGAVSFEDKSREARLIGSAIRS
jgi:hypothetical protein